MMDATIQLAHCENDVDVPAVGVTGNGVPVCTGCMQGEFAHAWSHVPEAFDGSDSEPVTKQAAWMTYVQECRTRLLDMRMAAANGGHIPWLAGCGEQADGSHVCQTADCIRVPRREVRS